jgi:tRNA nucleotidyltransferase (CCA-adding enzyme)
VKVYLVGGAVRDELLGLPIKERDYVVVGATPEEMVRQGFRPVGKDFPVFLHPETQQEYALARTERKSGRGYKGFTVYAAPEVTLEEDLKRRDLTINAMAKAEDGTLIDPFGGAKDLAAKVLRHVSDAFAEDPVRILRVARFAARFGFGVHPSTLELMKGMVGSGEADYLVPARVWQEFARGLAEPCAPRMFEVLRDAGLLAKAFAELKAWPQRFSGSVPVRFAHLTWPLDEPQIEALCGRLKAPNEVRELALAAARNKQGLKGSSAEGLLGLLKGADAFRRPERFSELLQAARLAEPGIDTERIERARAAASAVDAGGIAKSASGPDIGRRVDQARLEAIKSLC